MRVNYEKPSLIDLSEVARGQSSVGCRNGSNAVGVCANGGTPSTSNCGSGTVATNDCSSGGQVRFDGT
jgi:SynChlorMet cassette protein ScmA